MHIIIGIITAIAGLIWALYRLQNSGVDLNSFNPFHWVRRRSWEKQLGNRPIHRLEKPIDAAGVLLVAVAKLDGEITREQKFEIVGLFEKEFKLKKSEALDLYALSSHLLQDVVNLVEEVKNILAPCRDQFKPGQVDSLLQMLNAVAKMECHCSEWQAKLIAAVENEFEPDQHRNSQW
ncbi:MAG: TerB family tellurite resistance protein [Pseudomonadales bacterium]